MLFSLPNLQLVITIKLVTPLSNDLIKNYFMGLDGHIIITSINNEFIQGWLTFVDEESNGIVNDDNEEEIKSVILDPKRKNIRQDIPVKMNKHNIFSRPTTSSEYKDLVENCKLNLKNILN